LKTIHLIRHELKNRCCALVDGGAITAFTGSCTLLVRKGLDSEEFKEQ